MQLVLKQSRLRSSIKTIIIGLFSTKKWLIHTTFPPAACPSDGSKVHVWRCQWVTEKYLCWFIFIVSSAPVFWFPSSFSRRIRSAQFFSERVTFLNHSLLALIGLFFPGTYFVVCRQQPRAWCVATDPQITSSFSTQQKYEVLCGHVRCKLSAHAGLRLVYSMKYQTALGAPACLPSKPAVLTWAPLSHNLMRMEGVRHDGAIDRSCALARSLLTVQPSWS